MSHSSASHTASARENPQAVVFDFDGVLVDSEPLHEWAIGLTVEPRGWTFDHAKFVSDIVGRGDRNAYRRIAEWNGSSITESEIDEILTRKWALMARGIAEKRFTVQPGAIERVRAISKTRPVGVCSGSVRGTVEPMLEAIGLRECFRVVVCAEDVQKMKPDPEGYLAAARALSADPSQCVAIEDTPTGVKAARAAGMHVVGVAHTVPREHLHEAHEQHDSLALWRPAFAGFGVL